MKTMTLFAAGAFALCLGSVGASAMPLAPAPSSDPGVEFVRGGCGPGWTRDPWGRCVPLRRAAPPPRCWWEWTAWGRRRVCRW